MKNSQIKHGWDKKAAKKINGMKKKKKNYITIASNYENTNEWKDNCFH